MVEWRSEVAYDSPPSALGRLLDVPTLATAAGTGAGADRGAGARVGTDAGNPIVDGDAESADPGSDLHTSTCGQLRRLLEEFVIHLRCRWRSCISSRRYARWLRHLLT
jgi:hypothetical protein